MTYLLTIMERTDEELVEVHAFLWDRFREVGVEVQSAWGLSGTRGQYPAP